jgi:hypothetical protein
MLPKYAKKAFLTGRKISTSLDNARRRADDNFRTFKLENKEYNLNREETDKILFGTPYIYTVNEISLNADGSEEVIKTYTFKDVEAW